jgi:hypothetical protein
LPKLAALANFWPFDSQFYLSRVKENRLNVYNESCAQKLPEGLELK